MISIVTPWLDHPELIPAYEQSVRGAQVIIVDNGSAPENSATIEAMVNRLGGVYIKNNVNMGYAAANNQGLAAADGEIVVFLNNDISASGGWLDIIADSVKPGQLCGANLMTRNVDGIPVSYIEGWCIAAQKSLFVSLGGWNAEAFPGLYYEDNELCFRAMCAGASLHQLNLPIQHLSNYTSRQTPGAYDNAERNRAVFEKMVMEWRNA